MPGRDQPHNMVKQTSPPSTGSGDKWTVVGVCCLLVVIVLLVFGRTLRYGFVNFDDNDYVYQNAEVTKGLTLQGIVWAFTDSHAGNWHPLTWLSHMLDCQLYGLNAGGHHLTNVLLHAATAILLFLVLRQMTAALWPSAFVAAVFAVHPLRVESVAWVSERKDVLSGLFFMLTLHAYVRYARSPFSLRHYLAVAICLGLGLMSKPMLVTMPLVLLLLDYWPLGRVQLTGSRPTLRALRPLLREKLPLLLLAAGSSVVTFVVQRGAMGSSKHLPLQVRLLTAMVSYGDYVAKMIWPDSLAVLYSYQPEVSVWKIACGGVLLLSVTVAAVMSARRVPYLIVGWLWYLGMLIPVIGIVQVGDQSQADRYTYLPQIGLYLIVAWATKDWTVSWRYRRQMLGASAFIVITALMACTTIQTSYWRNSELLWEHTLSCTS